MTRYNFTDGLCIKGQTRVKPKINQATRQRRPKPVSELKNRVGDGCDGQKGAYVGDVWNSRTSGPSPVPGSEQGFLQCLVRLFCTHQSQELGCLSSSDKLGLYT